MFINQPEVGILAFLLFRESDAISVLVQVKAEPGNVEVTQIAPSIQATLSNYSRVHGGSETAYLSHLVPLLNQTRQVVNDTLQSEHGEKFYKKLNRNITVFVDEMLEPLQHFKWVPISAILSLLLDDYAVNTDARSVLVTSDWSRFLPESKVAFSEFSTDWAKLLRSSFYSESQIDSALDCLLALRKLERPDEFENRPLRTETNGGFVDSIVDIFDPNNLVKFFNITSNSREVTEWKQPLFLQKNTDRQILIARLKDNGVQFLLKCRSEAGLVNKVEFGTSLSNSDLSVAGSPTTQGFIEKIRRIVESSQPYISVQQSDEEGRFFESICAYQIYFQSSNSADFSDEEALSNGYVWVNLRTIQDLCLREGFTTNELRSTVSLLLYWL